MLSASKTNEHLVKQDILLLDLNSFSKFVKLSTHPVCKSNTMVFYYITVSLLLILYLRSSIVVDAEVILPSNNAFYATNGRFFTGNHLTVCQ